MVSFNPETDIKGLKGKTILITGGTARLGREAIFLLWAASPAQIIFTGRSQSSADNVTREFGAKFPDIDLTFLAMDLSSLASVRDASLSLLSRLTSLDIMMLNAGVGALPPGLSKDGYEIQFATNHLGHAMLAQLLPHFLRHTASSSPDADVRIVSLSSQGAEMFDRDGLELEAKRIVQDKYPIMGTWRRYGQSKLANILYAKELAARYQDILTVAIHPGIGSTSLERDSSVFTKLFISIVGSFVAESAYEVTLNQVWAATAPRADGKGQGKAGWDEVETGIYYHPVGVKSNAGGHITDVKLPKQLWDWTEKELKPWLELK